MKTILSTVLVGSVAAGSARAQELLWRASGLAGDSGGGAIASGYDLDGDGVADVVSGGQQSGGKGVVQVYSGVDGALLYELLGDKINDQFGISVAMLPDLDGDGAADFVVGAMSNDWKASDAGSAYVYSGGSGTLLKALHGQIADGRFGSRLAAAGDVDGDGVGDFLVAAYHDSTQSFNGGAVFLYSGATFAPLQSIYCARKFQPNFGGSVSAGQDVDGDGVADFIVGAPNDTRVSDREGAATVYSGADGHVIWDLAGPSPVAVFGQSVALLGDLDGDGLSEFAVGAPFIDHLTFDEGSVFVYSGSDMSLRVELVGTESRQLLGSNLANVGDVDGDGVPDFTAGDNTGTRGTDAGAARLFSGRTLRQLYRFDGEAAGDNFGVGLTATGDLDGDGLPDLAIGAPYSDVNGNASGASYAFGTAPLWLQADPDVLSASKPYKVTIADGAPGATAALVLTEIDGVPTFHLFLVTTLDGNGEYKLTGNLASGLGVHVLELRALATGGFGPPIEMSRVETIKTN